LINRPWVVAHHTWIARTDGRLSLVDRLKLQAIQAARNISVSRAIAAKLGVSSRVIPNPYRDDVFRRTNAGTREGDLVFVGRLVSDKGVDLLLDALAILKARGVNPRTTIVGAGPERDALDAQVRRLDLSVAFAGVKQRDDLVPILNAHRLLVVPSRWEEPFGVVALEGMACGCVPVVARSGGLPDAIGDAGVIFEKGDAQALAHCIEQLLRDETRLEDLRDHASAHLERHRAAVIAGEYLEVFAEALR
jgi:glycosyltransferase involved in cell wall biosynthesis